MWCRHDQCALKHKRYTLRFNTLRKRGRASTLTHTHTRVRAQLNVCCQHRPHLPKSHITRATPDARRYALHTLSRAQSILSDDFHTHLFVIVLFHLLPFFLKILPHRALSVAFISDHSIALLICHAITTPWRPSMDIATKHR